MRPRKPILGLVAAMLFAGTASAQQPAGAAPDIDPEAIAALDRMGAYLKTVKTFRVRAETTRDTVLDDGLLVQKDTRVDILAQFPTRLRVDTESSDKARLYLYDGKNFTLYGKRIGYYATIAAPPTAGPLAEMLADKYDIELPLEDLFWWGTERVDANAITAAADAGPSDVEGTTCQHYVYRQDGVDWQIWIQLGAYPLPLKQVITTTTDEARPQYTAIYTWDLAPSFNDAAFTFDPPPDARRIVFATEKK